MRSDSSNIIIDKEVKGTSDKMRESRTVIGAAADPSGFDRI